MTRKWLVCSALPLLLVLMAFGCNKPEPEAPPPPPEVEAEPTPPPATDVDEPAPPAPQDPVEQDPLDSEDMREVNAEAAKQGFHPDVYFAFDQSNLREEAREKLSSNARWLRQYPEFVLRIEGHCDERGTNEYNLALGERRANTAKDYLVSLGIDADRLNTISYGEERPVCTESDEACWQRNRRAHLVITGRR